MNTMNRICWKKKIVCSRPSYLFASTKHPVATSVRQNSGICQSQGRRSSIKTLLLGSLGSLTFTAAPLHPFDTGINIQRKQIGRGKRQKNLMELSSHFRSRFSSSAVAAGKTYPLGAIASVLESVEWPDEFPFGEEDFKRYDESADSEFYSSPRFVKHIDDKAIEALTKYYSNALPTTPLPSPTKKEYGDYVRCLDMCSSWISHYPDGYNTSDKHIVGLGMNKEELSSNPILNEYLVQDLNTDTNLKFDDNSFDCITNCVSVDYLARPLDVFKEMNRVLKPGGKAIMSFSNRCFPTKAIAVWTATGDADHVYIVGSYFHYSGFSKPVAVDVTPKPSFLLGPSDPMFIVEGTKAM